MKAIARAMRWLGKRLSIVLFLLAPMGRKLVWLGKLIFGNFVWQPPRWFGPVAEDGVRLRNWLRKHEERLLAVSGMVLLAAIVAGGGLWFWSQLPKPVVPELIRFRVTPPPRTPNEDSDVKPQPLRVEFNRSVASIARIGKEALGFSMDPSMEGIWTWINDKRRAFGPGSTTSDSNSSRVVIGRSVPNIW